MSAVATGGVWAGVLKQTTNYPAVAYRKVSHETQPRLNERGHSGLAMSRFRFFSTANLASGFGYDLATQLDEAIRLCLHGFKGTVTDDSISPPATLEVFGIFQASSFDFYDDPTQTYQVISDYDVWAEETQPT